MKRITATSPINGMYVQVHEFDATKAEVRDYSESVQPYGLQTAQAIVEALREAGVYANLAQAGTQSAAQITVDGSITLVEGGNAAARLFLGGVSHAGATHLGVQGTVRRTDGTLVGQFAVDRLAWMDIWWSSADRLLSRASKVIGYDVASDDHHWPIHRNTVNTESRYSRSASRSSKVVR